MDSFQVLFFLAVLGKTCGTDPNITTPSPHGLENATTAVEGTTDAQVPIHLIDMAKYAEYFFDEMLAAYLDVRFGEGSRIVPHSAHDVDDDDYVMSEAMCKAFPKLEWLELGQDAEGSWYRIIQIKNDHQDLRQGVITERCLHPGAKCDPLNQSNTRCAQKFIYRNLLVALPAVPNPKGGSYIVPKDAFSNVPIESVEPKLIKVPSACVCMQDRPSQEVWG